MEQVLRDVKQALAELEASRRQHQVGSHYAIYKLDEVIADLRLIARLLEADLRRAQLG